MHCPATSNWEWLACQHSPRGEATSEQIEDALVIASARLPQAGELLAHDSLLLHRNCRVQLRVHLLPQVCCAMSVHCVLLYLLLDYMGWWAPVCCGMSVHRVLWCLLLD
jgi:hypothetical protein